MLRLSRAAAVSTVWHTSGMPATSDLEGMLRDVSLRVTHTRGAVPLAVHDHPHSDTYSTIGLVREELGVVCRSCGAVADVDCAVGTAPCLTAADDHGFVIEEAEVFYSGLCRGCSTAGSPESIFSSGKASRV